jgi:sphingomyelin phosphodiesterase
MKMLHLTDVHLDLWYTPGSNAECEEPLCCRSTSHGHNYSAGYWSETFGSCDAPLTFTKKAIKHIGDTHKDIDLVIWTGDNVPHDVWNTTQEINLRHIHTVTDLVKVAFNGKKVFPCLGNHETHPINMLVQSTCR